MNTSRNHDFLENKWNQIYKQSNLLEPANVLVNNEFLLQKKGCALDLACGLGANALFLAEQGLETHAWDISDIALNKIKKNALQKNLNLSVKKVFLEPKSLPKNTFDVIVVSRFLDRLLCNAIMEGLKVNGLLFYQTYVKEKVTSSGPKNPDYLLSRNELLDLFQPLKLVSYTENSLIGDLNHGERNEAFFVGQKV